jgi:hypothetical protein
VFHLLDHWRQRKEDGLAPLIWNPSCTLLSDVGQQSRHVRNQRPIDGDSGSNSHSDDEDFAAELARISEDGSELYNSPPPPPSPHQTQSKSGRLEPEEPDEVGLQSPSFEATSSVPRLSCESNLSMYAI